MIESVRDYDNCEFVITCDMPKCGANEIIDGVNTIKEAVQFFRSVGWMITLVGEDWRHFCPDCKEFDKFTRRPNQ